MNTISLMLMLGLVLAWLAAVIVNYWFSPQRKLDKVEAQIEKIRKEIEYAKTQRDKAIKENAAQDVSYWLGRFVRLQQELHYLEKQRDSFARQLRR